MRVKRGKMIAKIKSPKYTKIKVGKMKKIGVRNIPASIGRAKRPRYLRVPTLETGIRKGLKVVTIAYKALTFKHKPKRKAKSRGGGFRARPYKKKGPFDIVEIGLSEKGKEQMKDLKNKDWLKHMNILMTLGLKFHKIHGKVFREYYIHQKFNVAKDTGELRKDLQKSLTAQECELPPFLPNYKNLILKIGFGSDLPYAQYISKARHSRTGRYIRLKHHGAGDTRSWRTGQWLNDPQAVRSILNKKISPIMNTLKNIVRNEIKILYVYIATQMGWTGRGGVGISVVKAKAFFEIKHLAGKIM